MSFQLIDIPHWFLIIMSLHVGVSLSPGSDVIFMQLAVKVNGAYMYYCDVLLLKQLLPEICQTAGDFDLISSARHHVCARALSCCEPATPDFTPDITWPPNRPGLNSIDSMIWTVIQECIKQQVSSYVTDKLYDTIR